MSEVRPLLIVNILKGTARRPDKVAVPRRVGWLRVTGKSETDDHWVTECLHCTDKTVTEYSQQDLLSTLVSSCGCKKATNRDFHEYNIWLQARNRCRNPNNRDYREYGGRGIVFDPAWDEFAKFYGDMGPKYGESFQLERLDNDGNYTAENCVWAMPVQQAVTRRKPTNGKRSDGIQTTFLPDSDQRLLLAEVLELMDKRTQHEADRKTMQQLGTFDYGEVSEKWSDHGIKLTVRINTRVSQLNPEHQIVYWQRVEIEDERKRAESEALQQAWRHESYLKKLAAMTSEDRVLAEVKAEAERQKRERKERIDSMAWDEYVEYAGLLLGREAEVAG